MAWHVVLHAFHEDGHGMAGYEFNIT